MPAIASHSTDTQEGSWDGPENVRRLRNEDGSKVYRQMFAWVDPDANPHTKSAYKFAHHYVKSDGAVGAASIAACRTGIAVLNGGRGGTTIPAEDTKGVWNHLARHLRDAELEPPALKTQEETPVVSRQSSDDGRQTDGDLGLVAEEEDADLVVGADLKVGGPRMQTHAAVMGRTRRETFEGREYLVAPVVALVPGVLNGFLNPPDEVAKYVDAWNDAPVPIGHPTREGVNVSARSLDVLAHEVIGRFQNVTFEENRLKGELWLEIEKAERVGDEAVAVLAALEAGEPVEVSTAYFADQELVSGEWNGVPYQGINRNIRPDHLALLPGSKGACSWKDGCGAPRIHEDGGRVQPGARKTEDGAGRHGGLPLQDGDEDAILKTGGDMRTVTIALELSLDELLGQVYEAFNARFRQRDMMAPEPVEGPWVREVFTDRVIADTGKGLVAVPYTRNEAGGIEFGEPVAVEIVYQPIDAGGMTATNRRNGTGDRAAHTGGCPCMDDEQRLDVNEEPQEEGTPEAAAEPQAPVLPADLVEFQKLVADLGGAQAVREMLAGLKANADNERAALVTDLTANERCAFSADELRAMPTATLDKLAQSLRPADYSGRGGPRTHQQADEWTVLAAPEVK